MFPFKNFFHFFYKPFSQSHHFMRGRWWESLLIFQKSLILLVRRIISVINWTATNDAKLPGRFLSFGILELASWASSVKKKRRKKRIHIWFAQKVDFLRLMDIILIPKNPKCPHHPIGSKGKAKKLKVPKFQDAWYICLFILIQKGHCNSSTNWLFLRFTLNDGQKAWKQLFPRIYWRNLIHIFTFILGICI